MSFNDSMIYFARSWLWRILAVLAIVALALLLWGCSIVDPDGGDCYVQDDGSVCCGRGCEGK